MANPMKVGDTEGRSGADSERFCLGHLRDKEFHPISFRRAGNTGPGPDGHIIDRYEIKTRDGKTFDLYIDMYHSEENISRTEAPKGLYFGSLSRQPDNLYWDDGPAENDGRDPKRCNVKRYLDESATENGIPVLAWCCNRAQWVIRHEGDPGYPSNSLKNIRSELIAAGPSTMDPIEGSLPHSLHLRRVSPEIVATWPSDKARSILITLVTDPDAEVATRSAWCLGRIGGVEVYAPLLGAVSHGVPMVRHNALNALNHLGQADLALDEAISRINDPEEEHFVFHSAIDLVKTLLPIVSFRQACLARQVTAC